MTEEQRIALEGIRDAQVGTFAAALERGDDNEAGQAAAIACALSWLLDVARERMTGQDLAGRA